MPIDIQLLKLETKRNTKGNVCKHISDELGPLTPLINLKTI